MQVMIFQLDLIWHDRLANHDKVARLFGQNRPSPGDLVVLPETFSVGFSMQVDQIADRDDSTGRFFSQLASQYQVTIIGGNVVKPDDRGRNIAIVAAPDGRIIARHEKIHPFTFAGEHHHYRGGNAITRFDWNGASVSPMICYDLRFPEAFRIATQQGAEIFVVIANWPSARVHHWVSLLVARAIENQAYVIACNRCGNDPNVPYPGRSMVIDPQGQIIADAGAQETILRCPIDLPALRAYRQSFPALADIRLMPAPDTHRH